MFSILVLGVVSGLVFLREPRRHLALPCFCLKRLLKVLLEKRRDVKVSAVTVGGLRSAFVFCNSRLDRGHLFLMLFLLERPLAPPPRTVGG